MGSAAAGLEAEDDDQVHFPPRDHPLLLIPDEFRCPISGQVMADPVIVASGQSYERSCIQAWLEQGRSDCYKSNTPLDHHLLIPNVALRTAILGWSAATGSPKPQPVSAARAARLVRDLLRHKKSLSGGELGKSAAAAPVISPIRYVHSATGVTLRELSDSAPRPAAFPHPLDTNPSSLTPEKRDEPRGTAMDPRAVQQLIKKLRKPSEQESAAAEIRALARESAFNRRTLAEPELLEALVALFQSPHHSVLVNCVTAILNLSLESDNKVKIVRAGAAPHLIRVLKSAQPEVQGHAAGAIFTLAVHEENRLAIGVLGAIPPLIELLRSSKYPPAAQQDAAMALYYLSLAQLNRGKMIKAGLIPILINGAERPDWKELASRGLCILSCLASTSEGRTALLEINGVARLLNLLARNVPGEEGQTPSEAEFNEHAVAALLQLSHHNIRFKHMALQADAVDILLSLLDSATPRAKEKIQTLLTILKDSPSPGNSWSSIEPYFPRSYVRSAAAAAAAARRGDYKAESSHF